MKRRFFNTVCGLTACLTLALLAPVKALAAEPLRIKVQLIWGTNDPQSPNPTHHTVDASLARKLSKAPCRWKNYFEVNNQTVEVTPAVAKKLTMSPHCTVEMKKLGDGRVEVKLFGEGKLIWAQKENLVNDWPIILSGDAKNDTAWMVVIRKVGHEPTSESTPAISASDASVSTAH